MIVSADSLGPPLQLRFPLKSGVCPESRHDPLVGPLVGPPGKYRFLLLRADQPIPIAARPGQPPFNAREALDKIFDAVNDGAKSEGLDWTQVVMRGRTHSFEPGFHNVVGQWARGEKMDEVPPKPVAPAPAKK